MIILEQVRVVGCLVRILVSQLLRNVRRDSRRQPRLKSSLIKAFPMCPPRSISGYSSAHYPKIHVKLEMVVGVTLL